MPYLVERRQMHELSWDLLDDLRRMFCDKSPRELHDWSGLPLVDCMRLVAFFSEIPPEATLADFGFEAPLEPTRETRSS